MNTEERLGGYLGIAAKAGKVQSGEFSVEKAVRARKVRLIITARDASERTKDHFRDMCAYYQIPYTECFEKEELGRMIGKNYRATAAVTDERLAKAMIKTIGEQNLIPKERAE